MRRLTLSLLLLPLVSMSAYSQYDDFNLETYAQGTIGHNRKFESIGSGIIYSADTLLKPHGGYEALYRAFEESNSNRITVGVWQKAEAFNEHLKKCGINIPTDSIVLRMGHDAIFAAKNQQEIDQIAEEIGEKLSFERKINFISQVGASLAGVYDNERLGGGDNAGGIVTLMDMVKARQNGTKAGVCRDMHQAMAQVMVKLGVPNSFVVATQVVGGGHAVLLAQDPNNEQKSYLVNYGFASSQTSASPGAHLLFDSTTPGIGVSYRIYDAKGRSVATLPSGFGNLLNDFMGKDATNLDPLGRSESSFASVALTKGNRMAVRLSHGISSDNDEVTAITAQYKSESEHFPADFNLSIYNMNRETNMRGNLSVQGAFIDGVQHIRYSPVKNKQMAGGTVGVEVYGRVGVRMNLAMASLEGTGRENEFSGGIDIHGAAGTSATYRSDDGKTNIRAAIEARGVLDKADVRDEKAITFDLRDITGTVALERQISQGVNGYAQGTVVMRSGLGIQTREEVGIKILDSKGRVAALSVSHEGQAQGPVLAFVPGSLETYAAEISFSDKNDNLISGGVFCTTSETRSCGTRVRGRIKLPLGWDKF